MLGFEISPRNSATEKPRAKICPNRKLSRAYRECDEKEFFRRYEQKAFEAG